MSDAGDASYKSQYKRVMRWYSLIKEIHEGRAHDRDEKYYEDTYYAFFQNCYHLKDWIKNDSAIQSKVNPKSLRNHPVEGYVNSNELLQLCGDICNATKHLILDWKPKHPQSQILMQRLGKNIKLELGGTEPPIISIDYVIQLKGASKNAFEVATDCIELWKIYLKNNELDSP